MWAARHTSLADGRGLHCAIESNESPVAYSEVIQLWQSDDAFRTFFIELLARAPFAAFRWETPPVGDATVERPFEFVLRDSPELAVRPDPLTFAGHFAGLAPGAVAVFPNLGRDAILVAPCPQDSSSDYAHLGAWLRHAPLAQQHRLWQAVGAAMQNRLGARPVWLSTAGGGVDWLHVRLDERPKYYGHAAYRNADGYTL